MDDKADNHDAEQRKWKMYKLMFEFRGKGPFSALRDNICTVSLPWSVANHPNLSNLLRL